MPGDAQIIHARPPWGRHEVLPARTPARRRPTVRRPAQLDRCGGHRRCVLAQPPRKAGRVRVRGHDRRRRERLLPVAQRQLPGQGRGPQGVDPGPLCRDCQPDPGLGHALCRGAVLLPARRPRLLRAPAAARRVRVHL